MSSRVPSQTAAPISWPRVPRNSSIPFLREAAKHCKACDLWKTGTQTVFGEGSASAKIILVGEQPGDYEDIAGRPFIGPAGKLLDQILEEAGIDRSLTYVTNVVKHFKWTPDARGKRRIHKKPNYSEISACRQWLDGEIAALQPEILVCLGATAAQALLGKDFSVTREHGKFVKSPLAPLVMATVHPSSILRAPDDEARREQRQAMIKDFKKIAMRLKKLAVPA